MPRPGPRPYECVRRAWHSDRHWPIRGSLIQEIFRVVNEVHSSTTRKNKEWQEKLPLVVLKAEEIIYSKANSEAEYMDLKTLWDRTNDAINTIIRKDETTESGDLLHPCIEAALNLGCVPRRASRSQRHSNPRSYLSSTTQEATETSSASLKINDDNKVHQGSSAHFLPPPPHYPGNLQSPASQFESWYSASVTPTTVSSCCPEVESVTLVASRERNNSSPISNCNFPFPSEDYLLSFKDRSLSVPMENDNSINSGRVYPLYYSKQHPKTESPPCLQNSEDSVRDMVIAAGTPCAPCIGEAEMGSLQNFLGSDNTLDASNRTSNLGGTSEKPTNNRCDLSLRLGLPLALSLGVENSWTHGVDDVGSSSSCDASKFCDLSPSRARAIKFGCAFSSPPKDKGLDVFPKDTFDETLESCSSKWSSEAEGKLFVEASDKKRKVPMSDPSVDEFFRWK